MATSQGATSSQKTQPAVRHSDESHDIATFSRWALVGPSLHPAGGHPNSDWIFVTIIFVVLGAWAASISWNYNSTYYTFFEGGVVPVARYSWLRKTVYAIVAFYFGPIYILVAMVSDRDFYRKIMWNTLQNPNWTTNVGTDSTFADALGLDIPNAAPVGEASV